MCTDAAACIAKISVLGWPCLGILLISNFWYYVHSVALEKMFFLELDENALSLNQLAFLVPSLLLLLTSALCM